MAVSGIFAAADFLAMIAPAAPSPGCDPRNGRSAWPTGIDARGSRVHRAPSSAGKIGNKTTIAT